MEELIFRLNLLFVQSFDGVVKLIKTFDSKYGMNWKFAKMLQKKVCKFVNVRKLNLDEVLILLNASHKVNMVYMTELLDLQIALCKIAGRQLIDELDTICFIEADDRVRFVKERAKGYPFEMGYWDGIDSILNELHKRESVSEYNDNIKTVKRVLNRIIPEQAQI